MTCRDHVDYSDCVSYIREAIAALDQLARKNPCQRAAHEEVIAYLRGQMDQMAAQSYESARSLETE